MVGREIIKITLSLNLPVLPPPCTASPHQPPAANFLAISNFGQRKEDIVWEYYTCPRKVNLGSAE